MHKKNLAKKGLALITIIILIGITAIPVAGDIQTKNDTETKISTHNVFSMDPVCDPIFLAPVGDNSWYIDDVRIRFLYDEEIVLEILYSITEDPENPDWKTYDDWFIHDDEGLMTFRYKYRVLDDVWIEPEEQTLKLDKTPPSVTIQKKVNWKGKKFTFKAEPKDSESGINRVTFFLDGEQKKTDFNDPYKYIYNWTDKRSHTITAVAYDNAGFSNNKSIDPVPYSNQMIIQNKIIQRIQSINNLFITLLKIMGKTPFYQ